MAVWCYISLPIGCHCTTPFKYLPADDAFLPELFSGDLVDAFLLVVFPAYLFSFFLTEPGIFPYPYFKTPSWKASYIPACLFVVLNSDHKIYTF
jgi:hypothetical protein